MQHRLFFGNAELGSDTKATKYGFDRDPREATG
jgi:hypothetical protein